MAERRGPLRGAERRRQELLLTLLRTVREEQGLHQTDIALALARPQSFVSKYESGARRLDLLELKDVCDAVGIELAEFAGRFEAAANRLQEAGAKRRDKAPARSRK